MQDIKGFENRYAITRDGRVWSYRSNKFLKPHLNRNGYYTVELGSKVYKIHRLLAETFIPNPNQYPVVHHRDENPKNNSLDNLEWVSHQYNVAISNGVRILCVETNKTYISVNDCARDMNLRASHISSCLAGRLKSHGGYHFNKI